MTEAACNPEFWKAMSSIASSLCWTAGFIAFIWIVNRS